MTVVFRTAGNKAVEKITKAASKTNVQDAIKLKTPVQTDETLIQPI